MKIRNSWIMIQKIWTEIKIRVTSESANESESYCDSLTQSRVILYRTLDLRVSNSSAGTISAAARAPSRRLLLICILKLEHELQKEILAYSNCKTGRERRHVLCFVETAGIEPRTLGTGADSERAATCATRPGMSYKFVFIQGCLAILQLTQFPFIKTSRRKTLTV